MVNTAGSERMKHLEEFLANQDYLPELVRQHRESHAHEVAEGKGG